VSTTIIAPGTCLVRGKSNSDDRTAKRWYGYYGFERDIAKFCQSKDFVSKYASGGYQYHMVQRPLPLLTFPYISLEMFSEQDLINALNLARELLSFVKMSGDYLRVVADFGQKRVLRDVLGVLVPYYEDIVTERFPELETLQEELGPPDSNPDYVFAKLICEMGFRGWVRVANSESFVNSDEIFVCDIGKMIGEGYLVDSVECELAKC